MPGTWQRNVCAPPNGKQIGGSLDYTIYLHICPFFNLRDNHKVLGSIVLNRFDLRLHRSGHRGLRCHRNNGIRVAIHLLTDRRLGALATRCTVWALHSPASDRND